MVTHAGKQFVRRGRKALLEIGHAMTEAMAIGRGEDGHIRMGIFSSLASGFLSDLIESFGNRHTAVKLTFIDGNPAEHVAAIRKHQLDVAFVTGTAEWPGCDGQQLWTERVYVVFPIGHQLDGEGEVRFADLAGESFIVSESAPGEEIHDYLIKRLAELGRHPEIQHQAVGRDNLMRLVALGRGLTVTSEATTATQFPGVLFRPIAGEILPFCAVWSPLNINPALQRLLALAKAMAEDRKDREFCSCTPKFIDHASPSQSPDPSQ